MSLALLRLCMMHSSGLKAQTGSSVSLVTCSHLSRSADASCQYTHTPQTHTDELIYSYYLKPIFSPCVDQRLVRSLGSTSSSWHSSKHHLYTSKWHPVLTCVATCVSSVCCVWYACKQKQNVGSCIGFKLDLMLLDEQDLAESDAPIVFYGSTRWSI